MMRSKRLMVASSASSRRVTLEPLDEIGDAVMTRPAAITRWRGPLEDRAVAGGMPPANPSHPGCGAISILIVAAHKILWPGWPSG
jgi:hypothetical protein